ncbi:MFS transporter [Actinoplanes sp. TFC3]|uniref:MFS transporter n=1 Tax=Actinoplanes sp. TFC3 TaxID=1710355 RepID=UPI000B2E6C79|nr:MFS transporter [Actinoplanes sp. TFC3]
MMVLADLGRALALGVAVVAGGLGLPGLLVIAVVAGALSVCFDVAYQASLVRFLHPGQLLRGNSAIEGSRSAAQIGGPALGGALVSLLSGPVAAGCSALLFVLSFVSILRIRRREVIPAAAERPRIIEGVRFVTRDPRLRTVCLASAAFQFSFAATMTAYLVFLPRELHLSGGVIGLVLAAAGPGALLGSLLAARLPGRFGYGVVLVSAALIGDGVMLAVPAVRGPATVTVPALVLVSFVAAAGGQLVNVMVMAIRQVVTPVGLQGRVAATIMFAGMGMAPLGSLAGGLLAQQYGLRAAILIAAAGMLASPVLMFCSPLAHLPRLLVDSGS